MPLTTMADLGHHNKKRDIVRFFMQNETKERIRCGVTNHALEVFKSDFDRRTDDPLTTFNKHRAHIESSASAKYDRQDFEPEDGQTILVTIRDYGHLEHMFEGSDRLARSAALRTHARCERVSELLAWFTRICVKDSG